MLFIHSITGCLGFAKHSHAKMKKWIVNIVALQHHLNPSRSSAVFERIVQAVFSSKHQRRERTKHADTLEAYKSGEYPAHPTIGLGQAILDGLLEPKVIHQYAWTQKALHEGPVYLEAWSKASVGLHAGRRLRRYPYRAKNALDVAMSAHSVDWKKGWGPQSDKETSSPAMRLVQWVHERDPHWIGSNLSSTFFSSSMSVWETLLYHDTSTSRWAIEKWPEKLEGHEFPWRDWLGGTAPWMYPILKDSCRMPEAQWVDVAEHLAGWYPLQNMTVLEQLKKAMDLLGQPKKDIRPHDSSDRGIFWKALTTRVPSEFADPIGAALACAWPGMDPDCLAIKRHFYPDLGTLPMEDAALRASASGFPGHAAAASATVFLYDSPQAWIQAMMNSWAQNNNELGSSAIQLELPSNLLE